MFFNCVVFVAGIVAGIVVVVVVVVLVALHSSFCCCQWCSCFNISVSGSFGCCSQNCILACRGSLSP